MLINILRILVTITVVLLFIISVMNLNRYKELIKKEAKNPTLLGQIILSNYRLDCIFEIATLIMLYLICITFKIF